MFPTMQAYLHCMFKCWYATWPFGFTILLLEVALFSVDIAIWYHHSEIAGRLHRMPVMETDDCCVSHSPLSTTVNKTFTQEL
jgi:hypothetical protein